MPDLPKLEPRAALPPLPVVDTVLDSLLDDPLLDPLDSVPPVDVELPIDDPASVTNDVESVADAVLPDAPLPAPELPVK